MYKVAWIARYAQGRTKRDASDHWAGAHAHLMQRVAPLAGYVQSHVAGPLPLVTGVAQEETHFDGYACGWWSSRADFEQAMATPAWQAVLEDGGGLFDGSWMWNMSAHVDEHVVIDGPAGPYKVVWVVRFKDGLTRAEGRAYWAETHGPIFEALDIDRYVQSHVVGPVGADGEVDGAEIGFDGFSECWFRDQQQFLDAVRSPTWELAVEDGLAVFDMSQLWGAALREHVVVAPPTPAPG
jgi:hypothetical protein